MKLFDEKNIISDELRSIIANTTDLMFVKDANFVYIAASPNFAQVCCGKKNPEDVIGLTDFDLYEKNIASEYRKDDLKLIASNSSMADFEESYPLKRGGRSSCLSSKYLIHDKNGKPVAILGQYHDLNMQANLDLAHRVEINKNVTRAFNSIYFASIYADLISDTFVVVQAHEYVQQLVAGCKTNTDGMKVFVEHLVKPEFQERMHEFCDIRTLAERLKDQNKIECDYQSQVVAGWCRTTILPVERNDNGDVTHVLLLVSAVDKERARLLEDDYFTQRNMETIFNEVPGGIVLYEWNGSELKVLRMSKYYQELYGYSMLNDSGKPDLARIHPDDREDYLKAINHALTITKHLEYVFRVWNSIENRYGWTQINAISRPYSDDNSDDKSLIYALYMDVTRQKEAELLAAKKQASLEAALHASDQLCCEYDAELHVVNCLTENNYFKLPTPLHNYPECIRALNLVHPDDVELFISTVHLADSGKSTAHCDVRALMNGEYRWYSCTLRPFFDPEKGRNVAILTIIDATIRMDSIRNYEEQVRALANSYKESLSFCNINLTRDTYEVISVDESLKHFVDTGKGLAQTMKDVSKCVIGTKEQLAYKKLFDRNNMLDAFEEGQTKFRMEHLFQTSPQHVEWVESGFDLIRHPVTGDVVGVCHTCSISAKKISSIMLHKTMEHDYERAFVAWANTGEYYLFETDKNEFGTLHQDFWRCICANITKCLGKENEIREAQGLLNKEHILEVLESSPEFTYNFSCTSKQLQRRMQLKVVWYDRNKGLLVASIRNITDAALIARYRHDSEHDIVTGLYNRVTTFKKCRRLINEHPDEQFCMFHGDLRNFHLYNAFFGENAGNELLCTLADILTLVDNDYEYVAYGRIEADVFCVFFPLRPELLEKHIKYLLEQLAIIRDDFLMEPNLGVYMVKDTSMPIEAMFSRASIAAKSGKRDLLNIISTFDESMEQNLEDNLMVTSEMQKAIDNEEFQVYLQPKYSLRSEVIVGAEALVRWIHPTKGMISPGKFIPVFEGNGFITTLDRYMWEHVARLIRTWLDEGKTVLPISVNVSRLSMYIQTTVQFLKNLVKRYNIDPKYLELELTESAYMDDPEDLKRMLKELQDAGFIILMDDFGSGYSSLNTLRDLPVNVLKLDMKFLSNTISDDKRGAAVLSSVVRMSKLLGLPIVAEGVETRLQAEYLCSIGCEYVQGFLFARPMPVKDYEQLLANEHYEITHDYSKEAERVLNYLSKSDDSLDSLLADAFASPTGIIETEDGVNRVLRCNRAFMREFELIQDMRAASQIIREKLDAHNLKLVREAISDCANTHRTVKFAFAIHSSTGDKRFVAHLEYIGDIDNSSTIFVSLINITDLRI